jgi:cytochrome c oxidase subunit 1/cytochrome c oxidase subunit I+III
VYTYAPGLGWSGYNLIETLGAYLLAAGLLLVVTNLAISAVRGERVGGNPWGAPTLEWATTSPPPEYNFAVIPHVSSPYAMWDREDREDDARRLARGEMVFDQGHETSTTSVLDAELDEVLEMPSHSWAPISLAVALSGVFTMLLVKHWEAALVFVFICALVLAAWHSKEPQEALP